jgi:hypothetical protein
MATIFNKKLSRTDQRYMWSAICILGICSLALGQTKEGFENKYDQIIMSEPYSENNDEEDEDNEENNEENKEEKNKNNNSMNANGNNANNNNANGKNTKGMNANGNNANGNNANGKNTKGMNANGNNANGNNAKMNNNNVNGNNANNNVNGNNANNNVNVNNANNNVNGNNAKMNNNNVNGNNANNNVNVNNANNNVNVNNPNNKVNNKVNNNKNNVNTNVAIKSNNSVKNNLVTHQLESKYNNMASNVKHIKNEISEQSNSIVDKETIQSMLNENHKKQLSYAKAMNPPHMPNISQHGTRGVSNIFSPQIVIRKKKEEGEVSYNHNRDVHERQQFPEMKFSVPTPNGAKTGRIIRQDTKQVKDWQEPTHDLWKQNNNVSSMNNDFKGELQGPYYWDYDSKKVKAMLEGHEIGNPKFKPIWFDVDNNQWVDEHKKVAAIPTTLRPDSISDPLDNVMENMQLNKKYHQEKGKECRSYVDVRKNDESKFVREAIKNNTWKKFKPGYSAVDPKHWNVPQKRPPVCLPNRVDLPSAVFTQGTPANVLEFDRYGNMANTEDDVAETNVGSILPKFEYNEKYN